VKLGDTRATSSPSEEGRKARGAVVSAGVFKLRNGMAVQVNNTYHPPAIPRQASNT